MLEQRIRQAIREVPDFPKPGINFKDITPILSDHVLCRDIVAELCQSFQNDNIDAIVGVESRGFLFGMMAAQELKVPFVPVRKKGKLPFQTISYAYSLEYGTAEMEMHVDALKPGNNVMIHDDLLATGGTAAAAAELVQQQGATVGGFSFVIELAFLEGAARLQQYCKRVVPLVSY